MTIKDAASISGINSALRRFKAEVELQRRLSLHPGIVQFFGACCHIPPEQPSFMSPFVTSQVPIDASEAFCCLHS